MQTVSGAVEFAQDFERADVEGEFRVEFQVVDQLFCDGVAVGAGPGAWLAVLGTWLAVPGTHPAEPGTWLAVQGTYPAEPGTCEAMRPVRPLPTKGATLSKVGEKPRAAASSRRKRMG